MAQALGWRQRTRQSRPSLEHITNLRPALDPQHSLKKPIEKAAHKTVKSELKGVIEVLRSRAAWGNRGKERH